MSTYVAIFVFIVGIIGLFSLVRDNGTRTSKALWIPVAWLFINSSRPGSMWLGVLGIGSPFSGLDQAQAYLEGSPTDRKCVYVPFVRWVDCPCWPTPADWVYVPRGRDRF